MTLLAAALAAAAAAAYAGTGGPRRRLRLAPARGGVRAGAVAVVVAMTAVWKMVGLSWVQLGVAVLAATVLAHRLRARKARRRRGLVDSDVVLMCFATAAELRAGRAPGEALDAAAGQLGSLAVDVRSAARAVRRGARIDDELLALSRASGSLRLETVAAVWAATARTGAGVARVLDRVGQAFAADDEARAELGALAAGPRATALVLSALPLLALGLGTAIGANPTTVVLHSSFGWMLTALAAMLDACGMWWVRTITNRALAG